MDFTQNIRIKFDSKLAFVCRLFSNLQSKVCQTANSLTKMTPLFVMLAYGYIILSFGKNETFFLDCNKTLEKEAEIAGNKFKTNTCNKTLEKEAVSKILLKMKKTKM